ncbi:MAG: alpha/beta hydrolase family protein [Caulobacterales bacterium]
MPRIRLWLAIVVALLYALPAASAPLEAYGALPAIEQVAISPDGQYLAIAATNGEQRTVAVQRVADRQYVSIIRVGDTKLRELQWAGSNHVLITVAVHAALAGPVSFGGVEHWGVIDFNVSAKKQTVLLSDVPHGLNVIYDNPMPRVIDGKPYAFLEGVTFGDISGSGGLTVFKVDLDRDVTTVVEEGLPHSSGWAVDAQGNPLAQTTYDASASKWTLRIMQGDEWRTVKTLTVSIEQPGLAGLGRDAKSILIFDRVDNEWVLREMTPGASDWSAPLATGTFGVFHDDTTGGLIGIVHFSGDERRYEFFNPVEQQYWKAAVAAYPGQRVDLVGGSADHRKLVVRVDSPTDGPAFALVDLDARSAHWIGAEYASLKPEDIGERRAIAFTAADGLPLTGYLTLPHGKEAKNLPLVVLVHGGPAARDEPGFDWWAEGIASRGYAVLQVNFRGSGGFGWKFLSAGFGEWGKKMQTDLSDGVRFLAAQGLIDPKRVCIVGGSYGGYAALAGATIDHGVYRCAVSIAGVADPGRLVRNDKSYRGDQGVESERYWDRFMGASSANDPKLDEISPLHLADKADIPILLIHGNQDTRVPFQQSQMMADALRRAGKPVELVTLKSEDHYLSRGETRLQMLQATMDFLAKNNPPG